MSMSNNVELSNQTIKKLDAIIELYEEQTSIEIDHNHMVSALIDNRFFDFRTKGLIGHLLITDDLQSEKSKQEAWFFKPRGPNEFEGNKI